MTIVQIEAHPYADRFPMLPEDELQRLAADIAENGLQNPIIVDADGLILDGRNRFRACQIAGIETPTTVVYEGDDPAGFVLSQNVARRHMTTGQQAMSTALVLADAGKRENGRWAHKALATAEMPESGHFKTWRNALNQAGLILDFLPEAATAVVDGITSLDAAYREAERRRDIERESLAEQERIEAEEAEALRKLADLAPAYLVRVGGEFKTARQAFTAWEDDYRREAAEQRRIEREAEQAKRDKWDADAHRYTDLIAAASALAHEAGNDMNEVMADFDPAMLTPNIARRFTTDMLRDAAMVAAALADWKESQ